MVSKSKYLSAEKIIHRDVRGASFLCTFAREKMKNRFFSPSPTRLTEHRTINIVITAIIKPPIGGNAAIIGNASLPQAKLCRVVVI